MGTWDAVVAVCMVEGRRDEGHGFFRVVKTYPETEEHWRMGMIGFEKSTVAGEKKQAGTGPGCCWRSS